MTLTSIKVCSSCQIWAHSETFIRLVTHLAPGHSERSGNACTRPQDPSELSKLLEKKLWMPTRLKVSNMNLLFLRNSIILILSNCSKYLKMTRNITWYRNYAKEASFLMKFWTKSILAKSRQPWSSNKSSKLQHIVMIWI